MQPARLFALAFLALTPSAPPVVSDAGAATIIVTDGVSFRLDKIQQQPGGQSHSAIAPRRDGNGFVATWLNYRSATDQRAYVGYFNSSSGLYPVSEIGAASGPTSGRIAASAAPIGFGDGTSLVLFSADKRSVAAANRRDIFAQRMRAGPYVANGTPLPVNTALANAQDSIVTTPLSTGTVLVAFITHASAASTFDIHGRVINKNAAAVTAERAITVNTAGAQTPTALAPLAGGGSVLAYAVKTGQKQDVYLQRLDGKLALLGKPILAKTTTGAATFGGAGVAALSGGRFLAVWFVAGSSGTAALKARVFSATGVGGAVKTIGSTRVRNTMLSVPRIAVSSDGKQIMVVTDGLTGATASIEAWLLDGAMKRVAGPTKLVTASTTLTAEGALQLSGGDFVASFTQAAAQPTATRAMAQLFHVVNCGRC